MTIYFGELKLGEHLPRCGEDNPLIDAVALPWHQDPRTSGSPIRRIQHYDAQAQSDGSTSQYLTPLEHPDNQVQSDGSMSQYVTPLERSLAELRPNEENQRQPNTEEISTPAAAFGLARNDDLSVQEAVMSSQQDMVEDSSAFSQPSSIPIAVEQGSHLRSDGETKPDRFLGLISDNTEPSRTPSITQPTAHAQSKSIFPPQPTNSAPSYRAPLQSPFTSHDFARSYPSSLSYLRDTPATDKSSCDKKQSELDDIHYYCLTNKRLQVTRHIAPACVELTTHLAPSSQAEALLPFYRETADPIERLSALVQAADWIVGTLGWHINEPIRDDAVEFWKKSMRVRLVAADRRIVALRRKIMKVLST